MHSNALATATACVTRHQRRCIAIFVISAPRFTAEGAEGVSFLTISQHISKRVPKGGVYRLVRGPASLVLWRATTNTTISLPRTA